MAGDKTYITDSQGKQHRATRVHAVTPTDIVWSSNPNDYSVQVKIDGKWHRAILTMDAGTSEFFENVNIDKALVIGGDGKKHTALVVKPESTVTLSDIKTDEHALVSGTTTGETAVVTYSESWSNVKYQDNVNIYKVLVTGSDGKTHTALLTTASGGSGGVQVIVLGVAPLSLPDAVANSLSYIKAYGGTKQGLPLDYTQVDYVTNTAQTEVDTGLVIDRSKSYVFEYRGCAVTGSWYILQSRETISGVVMGLSGATSSGNFILSWAGGTISTTSILRTAQNIDHIYYVRGEIDVVNGTLTLYVKDETANTEETATGTCSSGQGLYPKNIGLLGNLLGDQLVGINNDVYMARIKEDGITIMDYVPARQGTTAGFYDTVSGTFKTAETPANLSADGDTVPTPDAPMDIWCNNGALKARHQSGLPLGYALLDYIQSSGSQYIDTGIIANNTTGFDTTFQKTVNNNSDAMIIGSRSGTNGRFWVDIDHSGSTVGSVLVGWNAYFRTGWTVGLNETRRVAVNYNNNRKVYVDGEESVSASQGLESTLNTQDVPLYLFCANMSGTGASYFGSFKLFDIKITVESTLVRNLVPARRNSDNEVGMYDTVSGQFFTNQGTGSFVAGNPVSDPVVVYADGITETIWARGKNLWDGKMYRGQLNQGRPYIGSNTEISSPFTSSGAYSGVGIVVKVIPGQQYCFSSDVTNTQYRYVGFYANREDVTDYTKVISFAPATTATAPAGANYAVFCCANATSGTEFSWTWAQAEYGSTPTDYEPYYDGGTATAEMLLSIGDYTDVQEILSGDITRKVGVKVLDGTEGWTYVENSTNYGNFFNTSIASVSRATSIPVCNYFNSVTATYAYVHPTVPNKLWIEDNNRLRINAPENITTVAQFTQWLADQYNAGTPVIIVYPLATETTESVAGQTLNVTSGDNVIDITQASLTGLELEAEYTKEG